MESVVNAYTHNLFISLTRHPYTIDDEGLTWLKFGKTA